MTKTYTYDIVSPQEIGPQLGGMLDELPEWRRKKALAYRNETDRFLCAKAFLMLRDGLERDFGISGELDFSYNRYGKPSLIGHPEIHFSLSHCKKGIACAISHSPVGIDIEEIQFDDDLARATLSDEEYSEVAAAENKAECFTLFWTKKESYLKMLGCGIPDDLKTLCISGATFQSETNPIQGFVQTLSLPAKV